MTILARLALGATLALSTLAAPAFAHPDHDAPRMALDHADLKAKAKTVVTTLIARKIVEPTWAAVAPVEVRERAVDGSAQRVVVLRNNAVQDPAKRSLYVVMNPYGDYIAANHTGQ
jgi:hypothetical protein